MKFDFGIQAGHLLSMKRGLGDVQKNTFIGVKAGQIEEVCDYRDSLKKECEKFYDLSDQIVMPGLINAHTHLAMSVFRGYEDDLSFHEWLFERILPIEHTLLDDFLIRAGVGLSLLESIRFGTTTVCDMYYYPHAIAETLDQAGMRGLVGWVFFDSATPDEKQFGAQAAETRMSRFRSFYERYGKHPRVRPFFAPHAPYTCSDETLKEVIRGAREFNIPIQIHVAETAGEVTESIQKYGKTPVQRLVDLGILNTHFIIAHGVHLTDHEIQLLKGTNSAVVYNPDSNLKLGCGIAPIIKLRQAGISVAIGSDGAASNNNLSIFSAMDIGTKAQKVFAKNITDIGALDALNMATYEGARALKMDHLIGSIEVGKRADIISLRTDLPHVRPLYSVVSQLVFAYQGLEVDQVFCDGRHLFDRGNYFTLDPRAIYEDIEKIRVKVENFVSQRNQAK